ncbi:hypothetical protein MLD38_037159 [Melastoma candidum]|uniref:Uncharacterized protein n=1 Tax=Melastoma candidum TaxID=119954 RepID=A0ACB9LN45_9MYRT|nr:hypothetical protein MLD38_037159 [Melastoma candidum]
MPKNGGDWPTVSDIARNNQKLLVFTSKSEKEATDGIAYQWRFMVENQYGNRGMVTGSCPNRAESLVMNTTSRSLVLVNYFPDAPNFATAPCMGVRVFPHPRILLKGSMFYSALRWETLGDSYYSWSNPQLAGQRRTFVIDNQVEIWVL